MDFKGETPAEATKNLTDFFEGFATERGEAFEVHDGLARNKVRIATARFCLELSFNGSMLSRLKQKTNLASQYGSGRLDAGHSTTLLKLVLDEEGYYRWHRIPGKQGILNRSTPQIDAHWFPLLSNYLVEVLTAEQPPKPETNVLPMK